MSKELIKGFINNFNEKIEEILEELKYNKLNKDDTFYKNFQKEYELTDDSIKTLKNKDNENMENIEKQIKYETKKNYLNQ